ncbi:MAG TPA: MlaD family protein [Nitriliruptorales bacterium]
MTSRRLLVPLLVVSVLSSACGVFGDDDQLTVSATFDDVADLVTQAHVRAGDVPIGTVTGIELADDRRARVTMQVRGGTGLPSQPIALLQKTSLLGERFIELRPPPDGGSGTLSDGASIDRTEVVGDLEDLVGTGNELLALVAADALTTAVETGATAFGGRGGLLGQFIGDVEVFVGRYDEGSGDLVRLLDNLDALVTELAPDADLNAEGIAVLERASRVLEEEDERLLDALDDVRRLAVVGTRIMQQHRTEIDNVVRRLRMLLEQVLRIDGALAGVLAWLPRHNTHVPNGAINEHAQVWLDFLICGFQEVEDDPSARCEKTQEQLGSAHPPPPVTPVPPGCDDDHAHCPGDQRWAPGQPGDTEQAGGP